MIRPRREDYSKHQELLQEKTVGTELRARGSTTVRSDSALHDAAPVASSGGGPFHSRWRPSKTSLGYVAHRMWQMVSHSPKDYGAVLTSVRPHSPARNGLCRYAAGRARFPDWGEPDELLARSGTSSDSTSNVSFRFAICSS